VKGGTEAAVHAAKFYLRVSNPEDLLVKLDFSNAFNCICKDKVLDAVETLVPKLLSFVHATYSSPTTLFGGEKNIPSSKGIQQGYPLGPLLFCRPLHSLLL
jgi:hypothetical protein